MRVVFITNRLTHHQVPFCNALRTAGILDGVILCQPIEAGKEDKYPDYNLFHDVLTEIYAEDTNNNVVRKIIESADVVITGSAPEDFLRERIKAGKLIFRYSERPLKKGLEPVKFLPRLLRWHARNPQGKPIYMLCASAYTAADYAKFGLFRNRCYKWGYFPEAKRYDEAELFKLKQNDIPKILWCGRFLDWKHPGDAVRVAERLKQAGCRFELNFVGTGELELQLAQMIRERGLEDCVRLLGAMPPERVREHMEQANIYLFTSDHQEGWGAVLNESMNSGCAVVASHAIGSVPFLMQDGKNGLVYESGNVDMLCEKVKYLLNYPEEQTRLGRAAYRTIAQEWSAETAVERFIELAQRIMDGEKHPNPFASGPCSRAKVIKDKYD